MRWRREAANGIVTLRTAILNQTAAVGSLSRNRPAHWCIRGRTDPGQLDCPASRAGAVLMAAQGYLTRLLELRGVPASVPGH